MYYPQEVLDEVLANTDIVDVVSAHVHLKKQGKDYVGLCPFHNEKTPSFNVIPGKNMYYCFGCGAGGNAITFLMKYNNSSFQEALQELADRAQIVLPAPNMSEETRKREKHRQDLLAINKETAVYYYKMLRSRRGERGMKYFRDRNLSPETMQAFGLGFADGARSDLTAHLRQKGFSDDLILESDVALFNEKQGLHDRFWNRVMFPIQDVRGRVIGFGGRVLGDGKPKYINSSDTQIFDKGRNLYALNLARRSRRDYLILCEGYMDVIAMHQAGFPEAVASLGTAFTPGQAALLRRYTKKVLLAYDSDGAGVRAALRNIGILRRGGLESAVIDLRPHKDPDEFIKTEGREAFQARIDKAENSFFYELRILSQSYKMEDPASRTAFHREIAKKLCAFSDEIERENYITAAAEKYFIKTDSLRRLVAQYGQTTGYGDEETQARRDGPRGYGGNGLRTDRRQGSGYGNTQRPGRTGTAAPQAGQTGSGGPAGEPADRRDPRRGGGQEAGQRTGQKTGIRKGPESGQTGRGAGGDFPGMPGQSARVSRARAALLDKQRMLMTILVENPALFSGVKAWISPEDFEGDIFRRAAVVLWDQMDHRSGDPDGRAGAAAAVISSFETPEDQEAAAAMFNTRVPAEGEGGDPSPADTARTVRELMISVKEAAVERMSGEDGGSAAPLQDMLAAKKQLQTMRSAKFKL